MTTRTILILLVLAFSQGCSDGSSGSATGGSSAANGEAPASMTGTDSSAGNQPPTNGEPAESVPDSGGDDVADGGAATNPELGFNDEFDVDSIDSWSLRHQVEGAPAQYSELNINQSVPGALVIVPTLTPGWFADGDAPLVFKEVTGNFSVETEATAESVSSPGLEPGADFNSAGLMARNASGGSGPENHIMVNVGRQNSTIANSIGSESKSTINSSSQLDLQDGTNSGRLILCRVGSQFSTYRLLNNETEWTQIGSIARDDLPDTLQVGMVANGFSGPDLIATFNYIRLTVPSTEGDCTPS